MNDSPFDFVEHCLSPFLQKEKGIVAVAVSGGPDSLALCHALAHASVVKSLHVLTIDHGLRLEAAQETRQVGEMIADWPCVRHEIIKRVLPIDPATKIQEEARRDRYALMATYCAEQRIKQLFVAHHQDDQAETFLFRLAKGSGLDGLGAMHPVYCYSPDLQIIRPFLSVPKSGLVDYCMANHIPFITDPSNENRDFVRGRLRQSREILEEEGLTPKRLAVTAQRLIRAREALDFYADQMFTQACVQKEATFFSFAFDVLVKAPEEIRLRVLAKAMKLLIPQRDYAPRMEKMERLVMQVFEDPAFKKASLGGCLISYHYKTGRIIVETESGCSI
ncbi:MAG: tRNA lysidine(34) synthetase TilS [Alphaproteobacteria bacterium CG_4_9_14_3_um_filter_47_13]|nr:MAG: tRNA lysidine(34) synthetase TilS [Alphaproteobacteria bacterium CG_4_9_14_3_um_filter_47_13]